jgi:hypothetical protein
LGGKAVRISPGILLVVAAAFLAGFLSHFLYQRWSVPPGAEGQGYSVSFSPLPPPSKAVEIPTVEAREVEKIKALAGSQVRIRGRVYRVGHSSKSDTYFLNFGPARGSFTAVIFASAVGLFDKGKLHPKSFEGKEVELTGEIKDHPQYGLEMILEDPSQVQMIE